MTTEELIAEIERLDAAATSGPWNSGHTRQDGPCVFGDQKAVAVIRHHRPDKSRVSLFPDAQHATANQELIASYRTLAVEAARQLRELQASHEAVMSAVATESFEVLQTLGKAMGYSPLSDFPEIYGPGEVPMDAVMTWEHTPLTIAEEAAGRLREAERLLKADEVSRAVLGGAEPQ